LVKRAHVDLRGSDIGSPHQPNVVHASDDALERWALAALEKEGLAVDAKAPAIQTLAARPASFSEVGGVF
jgi:hypothetical protein